ncbi:MAG: protease pro-enzyme activation domain-containing protein, partial [Methylococcus sp.]|nr:protease pro-enzyme activation domain-containing protein [Methylococcus sp.]
MCAAARYVFKSINKGGWRRHTVTVTAALLASLISLAAEANVSSERIRLTGHVIPALNDATPIPRPAGAEQKEITLTIVLKRDDQFGFDRYLREVYDPHSKIYRHFLDQKQIADKFGPSPRIYHQTAEHFRSEGFHVSEDSSNRLTLTIQGTSATVERVFSIRLRHYRIGDKSFYANDSEPTLPESIASHVQAISGLTNLAASEPTKQIRIAAFYLICRATAVFNTATVNYLINQFGIQFATTTEAQARYAYWRAVAKCVNENGVAAGYGKLIATDPPPPAWQGVDGTGQHIGIVAFDSFNLSDVADYIDLINLPHGTINNVSQVHVNGGANPIPGPNEDEVLLDIDNILAIAPGAKIAVYDAPWTGSAAAYIGVFNAMINDGVSIISNSWASCEDQVSSADAQNIDTVLQNAAAAGISVFNATGDSGSTCLDGSPNTASVPADSPHATAVGGTSLTLGEGFTYVSETWWDGSNNNPPSGQGGFGSSKFFSRPGYQDGINSGAMRSLPDVSANADPDKGVMICQASRGGCPSGVMYGGTSSSAPAWAGMTALLNQSQGYNLGFLNPAIYPLSNTSAFHSAASMGSDFAHVGLGSPNLPILHQHLTSQTAGAVSPSVSEVHGIGPGNLLLPGDSAVPVLVQADGSTEVSIKVRLADNYGNVVGGKEVSLSDGTGSAIITPSSAVSSPETGIAVFLVKDFTSEMLTFAATDVTDGITLDQKVKVAFLTPPATNAGLNAFPTSVTADGVSTTTITLTLQDALGRPAPGKLVQLNQTGHSVMTGPTPPLTDSNGQIQFTAVDQVAETVTYTATDVTDGNLPVPATGTVNFVNGIANGCGNGNPIAAPGFLVTPYATGFVSQSFSYGNINFGCIGAGGLAFDTAGNLYVAEGPSGNIYKFPPGGGVASGSTLLTTTALGPTLSGLAFDASGNLYASRDATTGNFTTGAVFQINPADGSVIRTVASGLTCPGYISIDPRSGDLFTDDSCGGGGSDNPSVWRISDPGGASPSVSVYTTLTGTPNGTLAFAPSGAIYAWSVFGGKAGITQISGTNGPATPAVTPLSGISTTYLGVLARGQQANSDAESLALSFAADGNIPGGIGIMDLTTSPPSLSSTLLTGNAGANYLIVGPDMCIYAAMGNAVFRITDTSGTCTYTASPAAPSLELSPSTVAPNPAQGASKTFTATLHYADLPAGTPVSFSVTGANPQVRTANLDAQGHASFDYTAVFAGVDNVIASTTVNTSPVTSNPVQVIWNEGKHVTFLSLNLSPASATADTPITVTASLTDVSAQPAVQLGGEWIDFQLGGTACSAATDASGNASCSLNSPATPGTATLEAHFAGAEGLTASDAVNGFTVMDLPVPTATPAPTAIIPSPSATPSLSYALQVEMVGAEGTVTSSPV